MNTEWHFPVMILASLFIFFIIIRIVLWKEQFYQKYISIIFLSILIVIIGMLFGRYGAIWGLKWWIYYPIPMLMTVFLPPLVLKMNTRKMLLYFVLSFLSAPLIHILFSFFIGWTEYMPFWKIPFIKIFLQ